MTEITEITLHPDEDGMIEGVLYNANDGQVTIPVGMSPDSLQRLAEDGVECQRVRLIHIEGIGNTLQTFHPDDDEYDPVAEDAYSRGFEAGRLYEQQEQAAQESLQKAQRVQDSPEAMESAVRAVQVAQDANTADALDRTLNGGVLSPRPALEWQAPSA